MNIWHDINPERIAPESFTAVIEISKGSNLKYELDKETGLLRLDRILYTATHYPENYGFIPLTYADDNDPLDVLVLSNEPIAPMSLVQCYPIGVMSMLDNGKNDEKIIAIPFSDPMYNCYRSIGGLPAHVFNQIEHFFTVYKTLEGKQTSVRPVEDRDHAVSIIKSALKGYEEKFGDEKRMKKMLKEQLKEAKK